MARNAKDVAENCKRILFETGEAMAKYRRPTDTLSVMAVTKTVEPELVNVAVTHGITLLGENRVQEYTAKREFYDPRAEIQFIGQLQTNKLKYLIPHVSLIQSVDSLHLAQAINTAAGKSGIVQPVLVEVNIGGELSKGGVPVEQLRELLSAMAGLPNLHVEGLMTIPPPQSGEKYFCKMQQLFIDISAENMDNIDMHVLSMGMSADYLTAIQYGSTLVRIGSALFGARV